MNVILSFVLLVSFSVNAVFVVKAPRDMPENDINELASKFVHPLEDMKKLTNNEMDIELVIEREYKKMRPRPALRLTKVQPLLMGNQFDIKQEFKETIKDILRNHQYPPYKNMVKGNQFVNKQELKETLKDILRNHQYFAPSRNMLNAKKKKPQLLRTPAPSTQDIIGMLKSSFKEVHIQKKPPNSSQGNLNWIEVKIPKQTTKKDNKNHRKSPKNENCNNT